MRKGFALALVLVILSASICFAAGTKIGVINGLTILNKSEAGLKAKEQLEGKYKNMKKDLDKQEADLEKLRADIQKQEMVLSQEAKNSKTEEFRKKIRDFQDAYRAYQQKLKAEEESLYKPILEQVKKVVEEYGKKNGYILILDRMSTGVVFLDSSIDITEEITVELNRVMRAKK